MKAVGQGAIAFRESLFNADPQGMRSFASRDEWDRFEARRLRYDLYWSLYQNNSYADAVHSWSESRKAELGITESARHLYNPAYRAVEFWVSHLMGGPLGSALPIESDNAEIAPAVARLWEDSNWEVHKDTYSRFGSALGDVGLKVVDDPKKGKIRLEVVHPGQIKWAQLDAYGHVKAYIQQRWEFDPRATDVVDTGFECDPMALVPRVRYTERCTRDGDDVVYETLLDGKPYAWNGVAATWKRPFGFVPMVIAHHQPIGLDWAMNAFHPGLSRFVEVDAMGSGLSDQINKAIRAPMLMSGVTDPDDDLPRGRSRLDEEGDDRGERSRERARQQREGLEFLYGPTGASATHLTFNLDTPGVIAHIASLNRDINDNFPELLADVGTISGALTATAMKMLRQQATTKVLARRPGYFGPLVRAQQMALAMGGELGYAGYEAFDLGSYSKQRLDHAIGDTPVFEVDSRDAIDEDLAFWQAAQAAVAVKVPLALYLRRAGWPETDIADLVKAQAEAKAAEPAPSPAQATSAA